MNSTFFSRFPFYRNSIYRIWEWDAQLKVKRISPLITKSDYILDIGSGFGSVASALRKEGYQVELVDIADHSISPDLIPKIYDGQILPFKDYQFDVALLLTILHHTHDPQHMICEAARVAKRIIIIEDIYWNHIQKYLTLFTDSLINAEWKDHPHQNHTDAEWKQMFQHLSLRLHHSSYQKWLLFYEQATYGLIR